MLRAVGEVDNIFHLVIFLRVAVGLVLGVMVVHQVDIMPLLVLPALGQVEAVVLINTVVLVILRVRMVAVV
jgi:hypothetical protein